MSELMHIDLRAIWYGIIGTSEMATSFMSKSPTPKMVASPNLGRETAKRLMPPHLGKEVTTGVRYRETSISIPHK